MTAAPAHSPAEILLRLAERCESASGPSRDLDAEIAVATFARYSDAEELIYAVVGGKNGYDKSEPGTYWRKSRSGASLLSADHYTDSLDHALALVPADRLFIVGGNADPAYSQVFGRDLRSPDEPVADIPVVGIGMGKTPALALCAAALRARANAAQPLPPLPTQVPVE